MKKLLLLGASVMLTAGSAYAAGEHSNGHGHDDSDDHHAMMAVGKPGKIADVTRSIDVVMGESDDGDMLFKPALIDVKQGETIRFVVKNVGEVEHEFVLDDHKGVMEHKKMMESMPEMEHDDPNSIRLDTGAKGEVIWTFSNTGEFEFACLIPGHYELGMKGKLVVAKN